MLRKVDVGDYPLDLVPLEKDVLSLELDGLFRRVRDNFIVFIIFTRDVVFFVSVEV